MKSISRLAALIMAASLPFSGMIVAGAEEPTSTTPVTVDQVSNDEATTNGQEDNQTAEAEDNYAHVKGNITSLADAAISTAEEAIAAAKNKDAQLVDAFVKNAEKAKADAESVKKALATAATEETLMELMDRAAAAKYQADCAKSDIDQVTDSEDLVNAQKAAQ